METIFYVILEHASTETDSLFRLGPNPIYMVRTPSFCVVEARSPGWTSGIRIPSRVLESWSAEAETKALPRLEC